jgi:hypothetical protein
MLLCSGGKRFSPDIVTTIKIRAKFANLYVAHSTIPEHESFRNQSGTCYIQKFCDVLDDKYLTNNNQVWELLNELSNRLSKIEINGHYVQTTDVRMLGPMTHKWYFPFRKQKDHLKNNLCENKEPEPAASI